MGQQVVELLEHFGARPESAYAYETTIGMRPRRKQSHRRSDHRDGQNAAASRLWRGRRNAAAASVPEREALRRNAALFFNTPVAARDFAELLRSHAPKPSR
jgi:hypothetical protein